MRVATYYNNSDIRIEEMPRPKIAPDELLMRVRACGICGSDYMEWYRVKKAPLVLGHEASGEIVEAGQQVKGYKVGDRIFVSHHVPCNTCHYCLRGQHTSCETLHSTNFYPGGFSEYIRVPSINVERGTIILPKEISFEEGTFIEPLGCVVRAQRVAELKPGEVVLILGSGISGLLHLLLARAQGASRVVMTDINEYKLKAARRLGADFAIDARENIVERLHQANEGRLADLVIVCTGALAAFNQALQAVDRGGTILCFAPTQPGVNLSVPVNDFWRKNIKIIHCYGASPLDNLQAMELLRAKRIPVTEMVTHRLKLSEAGLGFRLAAEGKDCIKVIIEPNRG